MTVLLSAVSSGIFGFPSPSPVRRDAVLEPPRRRRGPASSSASSAAPGAAPLIYYPRRAADVPRLGRGGRRHVALQTAAYRKAEIRGAAASRGADPELIEAADYVRPVSIPSAASVCRSPSADPARAGQ